MIDKMLGRPAPERPQALGYGSFADTLRTLEAALTPGPWLLGDKFSAADVYVGSQIAFATMMKGLEPTPALSRLRRPLPRTPGPAARPGARHGARRLKFRVDAPPRTRAKPRRCCAACSCSCSASSSAKLSPAAWRCPRPGR